MKRASHWLAAALGLSLLAPRLAVADDREKKLAAAESEATELGSNLPPTSITAAIQPPARRLVDAEVAFSLGDYDAAALGLFDLANTAGTEQETAEFYLGETLFQKHEHGAARKYFQAIIDSNNTASRYYQPSLLRVIEIAIGHGDLEDLAPTEAALDRLGTAQTSEAIYVKGKLAYAKGNFDEAIALFGQVPAGSSHDIAAKYYAAVTAVAKKDLAGATRQFIALTGGRPKSATDRRVVELSQMALGRLYYEQDQFVKSIDAYLLVDRHSDLFPDALYEVAWVYVKNKQYDKALRALELLALSEPTSKQTPTVRILEGNLRIRKAQILRQAIVEGTVKEEDIDETNSPETQYTKATAVFSETRDAYNPSYRALTEIVDGNEDTTQYLSQIAGTNAEVFQTTAPLPEAAAEYLAEDPDVQRAVRVQSDLDDTRAALTESEYTLTRLEAVIASGDRTTVYASLQSRRTRLGELMDQVDGIRSELLDEQVRLTGGAAAAQLTANRRALQAEYAKTGSVENVYSGLRDQAQIDFDALETSIGDVGGALDTSEAMAVAIRTYGTAMGENPETALSAEDTSAITDTLGTTSTESQAISSELDDIRRELQLARDLAVVGDETLTKARETRRQLIGAIAAEQAALNGAGGGATQRQIDLAKRAAAVADHIIAVEAQIDAAADRGLADAKIQIQRERLNITEIRAELEQHEAESKELGSTLLGASFRSVKEKFYDIVVRADVGTVDVAFAQKEDTDDDLKRLNLSRARDLKQLRDEFKDILEGGIPGPDGAKKPAPVATPPANGDSTTPVNSPDKTNGGTRVTPATGITPSLPTVKPDAKPATAGGK